MRRTLKNAFSKYVLADRRDVPAGSKTKNFRNENSARSFLRDAASGQFNMISLRAFLTQGSASQNTTKSASDSEVIDIISKMLASGRLYVITQEAARKVVPNRTQPAPVEPPKPPENRPQPRPKPAVAPAKAEPQPKGWIEFVVEDNTGKKPVPIEGVRVKAKFADGEITSKHSSDGPVKFDECALGMVAIESIDTDQGIWEFESLE